MMDYKEELETLFAVMDDNKNDCGHDDKVIDKLQSLIDNYCESKPECYHKWNNMAYSYFQCDKCFRRKGMHE